METGFETTRRGALAFGAGALALAGTAAMPVFAAASDGTAKIDVTSYKASRKGFGAAFIDQDEWRDTPVRHRYIHGGFRGNHTRFSFYMPAADKYRGRIMQFLEGGSGGNETVLTQSPFFRGPPWQFALAHDELGALLIESNQGHFALEGSGFVEPLYLHDASAESALLAKWIAGRLYGSPVHHIYVYGGSGGGARSIQCILNRPDVYSGGVPFVVGVSPALYWSAYGNFLDVVGDKTDAVIDALEVGGSGNPFRDLNTMQAEALEDMLKLGFPLGAANQMYRLPVFPFTLYRSLEDDPQYFKDFWSKPGYRGFDNPESLKSRLINVNTTFRRVVSRGEMNSGGRSLATAGAASQVLAAAVVDVPDQNRLFMSSLTILSGKAKGRRMVIADVADGLLVPFGQYAPDLFNDVAPGDQVHMWDPLESTCRHASLSIL